MLLLLFSSSGFSAHDALHPNAAGSTVVIFAIQDALILKAHHGTGNMVAQTNTLVPRDVPLFYVLGSGDVPFATLLVMPGPGAMLAVE